MSEAPNVIINFRAPPALRARARACARNEGMPPPEWLRAAVREACEVSERKHGQRTRAAAAAAADAGEGR